jgi:hypothetical protein
MLPHRPEVPATESLLELSLPKLNGKIIVRGLSKLECSGAPLGGLDTLEQLWPDQEVECHKRVDAEMKI